MFALEHSANCRGNGGGWWRAASSTSCIAGIISAGLPESAAWALALLVGINLLFGGSAMIAMALHARSVDPNAATPAIKPTP